MKHAKNFKVIFGIGALFFGVSLSVLNVFAYSEQVKTNDYFIGNSASVISTPTNFPFTLHIGDEITGINNAVKSVYFSVSGVYSGGGSMTLSIDGDATTTKTYTFPAVSGPTPFEFIYRDDVQYINPTSAGSYVHTLNIAPSGITIAGLGIKNTLSYRHTPPSCPDGLPTNEKVKTNEYFIGNSSTNISGPINYPFTFYIGDNITGVSNAVKSVYFSVSGVYSGGGSMTLSIDGDATTTKTYTFPAVSGPTPFEFIYRDDVQYINPTSGGSYLHTLNIAPSGITIAGLGTIMRETHRYKPELCLTYPATGEITSAVFESTGTMNGPGYNSIMWKGNLGGAGQDTGKVRFQFAASECANGATNAPTCDFGAGSWNFVGGANCIPGDWYDTPGISTPNMPIELTGALCIAEWNNKRYFRYKMQICSSNDCTTSGGPSTPIVTDVIVNWSP